MAISTEVIPCIVICVYLVSESYQIYFIFLEKSFVVDPSVIVVEEGAISLPLHFSSVDPNSKFVLFKHFTEDLIAIIA